MPRKNSIRLPFVDYRVGWFLVTTNAHRRSEIFGRVVAGRFEPSALGELIVASWRFTLGGKPNVEVRAFQVMPNHLHAVVGLDGASGTLGALVGSMKSGASRRARAAGLLRRNQRMWHRGYHARSLLDERARRCAIAYVRANPANWRRR